MDNSGAIVGPLIAFILLIFFPDNYRLIFLLAGIPAILSIFVIIFGIKEAKKSKESLFTKFHFKDFPERYYLFLAIIFIFTLGNSTDALLMVKANEVGVKVAFIPLVYLITSIVSVLLAIPVGSLSDKIGKEKILIAGFLIYAIVYYGFGVTGNTGTIVALFALYGLYSAATDGIQKAFVSDIIDKNKQGTVWVFIMHCWVLLCYRQVLLQEYFMTKSIQRFHSISELQQLISAILMLVYSEYFIKNSLNHGVSKSYHGVALSFTI